MDNKYGVILLANLKEYWSRNNVNYILFLFKHIHRDMDFLGASFRNNFNIFQYIKKRYMYDYKVAFLII